MCGVMINMFVKFEVVGNVYIRFDWDDVWCKLVMISLVGWCVRDVVFVNIVLIIFEVVKDIGEYCVCFVLLILCELCVKFEENG